jgi:hypothetical protein
MRIVSSLVTGLLVLLLLAAAYFGLTSGFGLLREAHTGAQWLATGTELLYGLTALLALAALASRHKWTLRLLIVWAAAVTATSALAPVVWGGTSWMVGAESGGGAGLLLAVLLWSWHYAGRRESPDPRASGGRSR